MNEKDIAPAFAALGHEARLRIYRQLVKAGEDGLNIDVQLRTSEHRSMYTTYSEHRSMYARTSHLCTSYVL